MNSPTPLDRWGKDHWSTLAYLHTCIVNGQPPNREKMRVDVDIHPGQENSGCRLGSKYPTILRDGGILINHDDWSCLEDAEALGMVEAVGTGLHPDYVFTDLGWKVARALAEFKKSGGQFGQFSYPLPV